MARKTAFFEGWSWFKFNNLGLALSISLKFYSSVAKKLILKFRKFWELVPTFLEVTGGKPIVGGGGFLAPPILNRVNQLSENKGSTPNLTQNAFQYTRLV